MTLSGTNHDFGVFDDPDSFYRLHGGNIRGIRAWLLWPRMRAMMNRKVASIRAATTEAQTQLHHV